MIELTDELRVAFADAYEPHVRDRLSRLGIASTPAFEQSVADGREWLAGALDELAALAFDEQHRGPLELFQEAMRFPTAVLLDNGVEPISRDEVVSNAMPGDHFGLAPASSQELGDRAWRAHLDWGAAKAAAMSHPRRVGILTRNLMDKSKLDAALAIRGYESVAVRGELPDRLDLVLVDLEHPKGLEIIGACVEAEVECLAFGPHTDAESLAAAKVAGATSVMPRSQVLRDPNGFMADLFSS